MKVRNCRVPLIWLLNLICLTSYANYLSPLSISTANNFFQLQLSGHQDLELYYIDQNPPGLIFSDDKLFFHPRLTFFLDANIGSNIYGFIKFRWDRGFDPGYKKEGDTRVDEFLLRYTIAENNVTYNFQVGKFATIFGNWAGRHDSWENPFINMPLPYENVTIVFDNRILPSAAAWLANRNIVDNKKNWVPIIWGPVYSSGVSAVSKFEKFDLALSIKNKPVSSRPNVWDDYDWSHPIWTSRIGYRPNAAWSVGVSASVGNYINDTATFQNLLPQGSSISDYNQEIYGFDISWARHKFQLWSELIYSKFEVPNVGDVGTFSYYIEAKYKWTTHFFSGFRWGQQFFDEINNGSGSEVNWDRGLSRIETSIGYRFNRRLQFKAQYSLSDQDGELEQGKQFVATQLTLKF